jgi:hypothetical protein
VLLSLEVWSDWLELRYAVVYATPEPGGELPRPAVLGGCEVSDQAGTEHVNWHLRALAASGHRTGWSCGSRAQQGRGEVQFVTTVDLR